MPTPTNILIVNVHSTQNLGDLALLTQTMKYLDCAFGEVRFTVLANWPDEEAYQSLGIKVLPSPWRILGGWTKTRPSKLILNLLATTRFIPLHKWGLTRKIPKEWNDIFNAVSESSLIVGVSGNQMFSSGKKIWPLPALIYPFILARCLKKPSLVFPQSIGPFNRKIESSLLRMTYNECLHVYLRDQTSISLARQIGMNINKTSYMPDPALTLEFDPNFSLPVFNTTRKKVGITIISRMPGYLDPRLMNNYYQELTKTISLLILDHNCEVYLFNQVTGPSEDEDDRQASSKLLDGLPFEATPFVHNIVEDLTPSQLKSCYAQMDAFVASRLHSGIFSIGANVPTIFIGYLPKTKGVLESIGLDESFISLEEINTEKLMGLITDLIRNQTSYRSNLQSIFTKVEADLNTFPNLLKTNLSWKKQ